VLARAQADAPAAATFDARESALLDYALALTRRPGTIREEDLAALRAAGLDDGEILDAAHVAAYYAYANRIASGLGLQTEPYRR
jgi:uncharacterized peroxidase-related enzyme